MVAEVVAALHREEWPRLVASLARRVGDLDLAEEAVQEAYAAALRTWPERGIPTNAAGWLTTVARNRALDRLRRDQRFHDRLPLLVTEEQQPADAGMDDVLAMVFACCHPALAADARVALTLRLVAGLETREIARAFLVPEATMAQRLVRAKRRVREAGIPLAVPDDPLRAERTGGVLAVVYLLFNEGYAATSASGLVRRDLAEEAIRLARLLVRLLPDDHEVAGLLALLLLQHSRRDARVDAAGALVLLEDQDRGRWDRAAVAEGRAVLADAMRGGRPGPYRLQAMIAAAHATAPSPADTDWRLVVALYDRLLALTDSPVVALNRAVAVAMVEGPAAGLALLDGLDEALGRFHLLPAARADLLRRLGRPTDAAACYREALALVTSPVEREFLARRLREVGEAAGGGAGAMG